MRYSRIVIEGNIGAGKTSLARKLAQEHHAIPILETFSDNPFLPLFYKNPERYALPLELFFMAERFQQLSDAYARPDLFSRFIVSDYMFKKSLVFARVTLTYAEFALYQRIFTMMNVQLPEPELIVFLYRPVEQLLENIRKRGRGYEDPISSDYLTRLNDTYINYFKQALDQRVLILDASQLDFVNDGSAYATVKSALDRDYPKGVSFDVI